MNDTPTPSRKEAEARGDCLSCAFKADDQAVNEWIVCAWLAASVPPWVEEMVCRSAVNARAWSEPIKRSAPVVGCPAYRKEPAR